MEPKLNYTAELRRLLRAMRWRTIAMQLAAGLVSFVAAGAWLFLILVVWTAASNQPALWKTLALSRAAMVLAAGLFGYLVIWPVVRIPGVDRLADEVERRKDLRELLRAGFEFSTDTTVSERYSPDLVREVIRRAVSSMDGLRVRSLFLGRRDVVLMPVAFGGLFVLLLVSLLAPSLVGDAAHRLVAPKVSSAVVHSANIRVTPGDVTVIAGSDVTVAGVDMGRTEHAVTIGYNVSEDFWKTEPTERADAGDIPPGGGSALTRYEYTFLDLRHTVSYYFEAGDYRSPTYAITVVHKPILTDLSVTLTPPAYTGEKPVTLTDNGGNVQALEGTRVGVEGAANNPLAGAWVKFDDGKLSPAEHDGRSVRFSFQAIKDGHYSVILEDSLGHTTDEPLVYTIEVYKDHPPSLDVLEPGADATLPRTQRVRVAFVSADDYGVQRASIFRRLSGDEETFTEIPVSLGEQRNKREVAVAYEWDLSNLKLYPGNSVEYYLQVADNNVVTGPGVTRSRMFRIFVPTVAELYDRAREEEARRGDLFEQAIEESGELRDKMEKITREYVKTEKMEWTQKKEIDNALEKQKAVEEALQDIKRSLDETLRDLSENRMTSQQIGEKIEEIRQLLDEIDSEELRRYMEELRDSIEKLSPEDIKQALENIEFNAEDILKKLERTANLLKELQREQAMEEIVRKSQDLMQSQKELADETGQADAADREKMDELAAREGDLARKADELQKSMEELARELGETDPQVSQALQSAGDQMDDPQGPQKNMRTAADFLKMGQKQQAGKEQQQAMEKLISLFRESLQAQQAMATNSNRRMAINLQKYAGRTLELSFRQEQLASRLRGTRESDLLSDNQEIAQTQNSYLKATQGIADEIVKLSGMSLAVSPKLIEALGFAIERMQSSVLFLEQNKPFMSTQHAGDAVESLNEVVIEMLRSAQMCSQPGSGGQSLAEQIMQQLIPGQQDIVRQTQEFLQLQAAAEQLRQERLEQAQRLAAQQRSLKELAENIQRELRENRELLGRMDHTIKEMEAVSKDLDQGNLSPDLVEREQRILSRLLDAQRSIHTRDYENERESITAADLFSKSLVPGREGPESQSLREALRRAMQLKAPGEFEDLIKLYFRALAEESASGDGAEEGKP